MRWFTHQSDIGTARTFAGEPAAPPPEDLFAGIQNAIRKWDSEPLFQRSGTLLKQRVAREIAPYLGARASAHILAAVSPGGENLLPTVEPILALFLGNRAASRLVDRVVDTVLVRG